MFHISPAQRQRSEVPVVLLSTTSPAHNLLLMEKCSVVVRSCNTQAVPRCAMRLGHKLEAAPVLFVPSITSSSPLAQARPPSRLCAPWPFFFFDPSSSPPPPCSSTQRSVVRSACRLPTRKIGLAARTPSQHEYLCALLPARHNDRRQARWFGPSFASGPCHFFLPSFHCLCLHLLQPVKAACLSILQSSHCSLPAQLSSADNKRLAYV